MSDRPETLRSTILAILAWHHWIGEGETGRWGLHPVRLTEACGCRAS